MITCIYRIVVRRPAKPDLFYIGQAMDFHRRKSYHLRDLRGHRHDNNRMQNLFVKYGEEAFSFKNVLVCSPAMTTHYEQAVLDFNVLNFGRKVLNIRRECVSSSAGVKFSAEARANMSAAKKGKPGRRWSEEEKAKVSKKNKGRKHDQKQVDACRLRMTGSKRSVETRIKMSEARKGYVLTEETKAKLRFLALNRSSEHKAKISAGLMGNRNCLNRKISEESRRKLSLAAIRRESRRKAGTPVVIGADSA